MVHLVELSIAALQRAGKCTSLAAVAHISKTVNPEEPKRPALASASARIVIVAAPVNAACAPVKPTWVERQLSAEQAW